MHSISLRGLSKRFGDVVAVDGVDLDIRDGEFFSMLGPSGSGKTTVLRLIAGFERATAGTIELGGQDVTATAPFDRSVCTVFQDYALFPHLSVLDNVAYGLRVRRVPRRERYSRARELLATVRLDHAAARRPHQLSGGQRQRVALARAIAVRPKVLLLDEPLGALDLKLREQMQVELKQLQRDLGITFVFVTHDQEEALTLSDRVAVFSEGRIVQLGPPTEIYEHPVSAYVAQFVGTSNLFGPTTSMRRFGRDGHFALRPEKIRLTAAPLGPEPDRPGAGEPETGGPGAGPGANERGAAEADAGEREMSGSGADRSGAKAPGPVRLDADRPGAVGCGTDRTGADEPGADEPGAGRHRSGVAETVRVAGVITESIYLGAGHRVHVRLDDGTALVVLEQSGSRPEHRGDQVVASWSPDDLIPLRGPDH